MRFMVIVKASKESEAGVLPDEKILANMGKYNEELAKAGVLLAGEGLHASSKGARVKFSGNERIVTDGPFAETKELIAGFWLWKVNTKEAERKKIDPQLRMNLIAEFTPEILSLQQVIDRDLSRWLQ